MTLAPLAALALLGAALGLLVVHLGRRSGLLHRPPVAQMPLATENTIHLPRARELELTLEGVSPSRLPSLHASLRDPLGRSVPLRRVPFQSGIGVTGSSLPWLRCSVETPGQHTLRIDGLSHYDTGVGSAVAFLPGNTLARGILIAGLVIATLLMLTAATLAARLLRSSRASTAPIGTDDTRSDIRDPVAAIGRRGVQASSGTSPLTARVPRCRRRNVMRALVAVEDEIADGRAPSAPTTRHPAPVRR